jgi:glucokinase
VFIENDANAAGWAESKFGAGRGHDDLVLITVGTGIGGSIVLDGALYRGRFGGAGEPGHMIVEHDGHPLRLRQPGVLGAVQQRAAR